VARCARGHESCASRRLRRAPQPARTHRWARPAHCVGTCAALVPERQAVPGGATSGATSGAGPGSARAARNVPLYRRSCLSGTSAASAASSAARPPDRAAQWSRRASADRHSRSPAGHRLPRPAVVANAAERDRSRRSRAREVEAGAATRPPHCNVDAALTLRRLAEHSPCARALRSRKLADRARCRCAASSRCVPQRFGVRP
jgi:hypothetical protein